MKGTSATRYRGDEDTKEGTLWIWMVIGKQETERRIMMDEPTTTACHPPQHVTRIQADHAFCHRKWPDSRNTPSWDESFPPKPTPRPSSSEFSVTSSTEQR